MNQGLPEEAKVAVYHRGEEQTDINIDLWQYRSIPLEAPGNKEGPTTIKPGDPISVDVSQPGNFLFTFTIPGDSSTYPLPALPNNYSAFAGPPWVTNSPSISLRILPNPEDFSEYYDPGPEGPVLKDEVDFSFVYEKVLKTYFLLYPAMNKILDLHSETALSGAAPRILSRIDPSNWMKRIYMPVTRDMSASRTELLQAWCRREENKQRSQNTPTAPKNWQALLGIIVLILVAIALALTMMQMPNAGV